MPRRPIYRHEVMRTPQAASPGKSLVASAKVYTAGSPGVQSLRKTGRRTRSSAWQNDIWDFYDEVPEFRAACAWVGNLLSKARLTVHHKGRETTDKVALDVLASLFGGPEGQEEMFRLLGINFTVAGEAFIVGSPGEDGEDQWEVIAATEVGGETTNDMTIEGERVEPGTVAVRLWKAHPRKSNESDCPARALTPVLAESVRLTQVVAAQADSRLKGNGILWVPSELEMPAVPVTHQSDEGDEYTSMEDISVSEGITQRLIKIASIAMQNRDSAAAGVPLVIAAPGEYLKDINWMDFWTGFDEHVQKLRDEVAKRIGIGMDMPPEALTGTEDVNHWGAWQIEEAAVKVHTEPLLAVIVSSLTKGYLHPLLQAWGMEDFEDYTFEVDTSQLRMRPNRSKEAVELFDRGVISMKTLLVENGFDPEADAPDQEERIFQFVRRMADRSSLAPEQLSALLDRLGVAGVPAGEGDARGALESPSLRDHPVQAEPNADESESDNAKAQRGITAALSAPDAAFVVDGLVLAAEQMIYRALERAGNRLKNKVDGRVGGRAVDLYLSMPSMEYSECESLLEDAWGSLERFEYPGVSAGHLRDALHQYTLMLLRSQKPMTRASLARHLMLEMADAA